MIEAYTPHMGEQENFQKNCANVNVAHFFQKIFGFASDYNRVPQSFSGAGSNDFRGARLEVG
jgi:hypothetical protein